MNPDEICDKYAESRVGLVVKLLKNEEGQAPDSVLIQGAPVALRMLAELINSVADGLEDDGFSISPLGAGSDHFSELSEMGIYIHRSSKAIK